MNNDYIVYMHISPSNKRYIGLTCQNPNRRWNNGKGYYANKHFTNAINKYGWNNFQHIIIARGLDEETAQWLEIELIREWDTTNQNKGYNLNLGGYLVSEKTKQKISDGRKGMTFSEEHRKNLSISHKNPSEETRRKISEAQLGRKHTEETKRKIGEGNKGKIVSKETRKKMSEAQLGKKHTEESKRKMRNKIIPKEQREKISKSRKGQCMGKNNPSSKSTICLTTKRIFFSCAEGGRYYGICGSNINACCVGKRKSCGNINGTPLVWRFLIWKHSKKYRKKVKI